MSQRARTVLNQARAAESLPGHTRERLLHQLEQRLALGEQALPELDVHPPQLPHAAGTASTASVLTSNTLLNLALGVVLIGSVYLLWSALDSGSEPVSSTLNAPMPEVAKPIVQPPLAPTLAAPSAQSPRRVEPRQPSVVPRLPANGLEKRAAARRPEQPAVPRPSAAEQPPRLAANPSQADQEALVHPFEPIVAADQGADPDAAFARPPPLLHGREPDQPGGLDEEMKLLAAAQAALRDGIPERALLQLAEHAWRFPAGQLAQARDVARIMALCRAGKPELSRSDAKRFLAKHPGSPFARRVRSICR